MNTDIMHVGIVGAAGLTFGVSFLLPAGLSWLSLQPMGQRLSSSLYEESDTDCLSRDNLAGNLERNSSFPDLRLLPPEISLKILSNVDAQELRQCKDIWQDLANDDFLWRRLEIA